MPEISFRNKAFPPVRIAEGEHLSEHLTADNTPLLFGCRTGICGTCLVRVEGPLPPPDDEELELLDVLAPGDAKARLACQLRACHDLCVDPHPQAE